MKRFLLLGLLFVIVFTLGMLSQFFFKSHSTVYTGLSFDKEIQKIINNNNELLYSNTKIRVSLLEHYISDTTISEYILMKKTDSIVDYFG
jgi:hypothetical protein